MSIESLVNDVRIGATVSTITTGSGLGVILDLIPDDIGKLATVVGIVLSVVLIFTHLRRGYIENKKIMIEVEILKAKLPLLPILKQKSRKR